ncbi:MAG: hypothetical protein HUU38_11720 [Anaerolineales bacterium]|nr:hypothetical protein [Anaerolineales bacterium]
MNQYGLIFFAFVALISWLVNLHFVKIRAWEKSPQVAMVRTSWLSTLFLAFAMTFQIAAIQADLRAHLFFWYLAYVTISLAIYFSALSNAYNNYAKMRHWATFMLISTFAVLSYLFFFHVAHLNRIPDHNIPHDFSEWLFMLTLFVYGMILGGIPILEHLKDYSKETAIPTRTRYITLIVARTASTIYFLVKIVMATLGFFVPSYSGLATLLKIHDFTLSITGLFWIGMFLPNKFLMQISAPIIFLNKWFAYGRLRNIPQFFRTFQPDHSPISVVNEPDSLWDLLIHLNFYLYRTVIHILDIKQSLEGTLLENQHLSWEAIRQDKAKYLHIALNSVEDDRDYWLLIHDYARVARQFGSN